MDILSEWVQDDGQITIQLGGLATDGLYRVALVVVEAASAAEWLASHQAEAQALIDAGQYNETVAARVAAETARGDFRNLPDWATWTGQQAADYIHANVLSGMTPGQVEAWVNANVTTLATAKTGLILVGRELADLRDICERQAQAILFLRDVVWHLYRKVS
jgi:acetylornithine deacetylase/succinyl-diaminopimelate desuccinylase-like protein